MALAREETRWDGGYPNLAQEVVVNDAAHPEFHGSNIFGLIRVTTPDGKQHLVGTVSKSALIMDFTTGKVVYDFSSFGVGPRAGGDSYNAVAFWKGRYYFGGWVITPSPIGASFVTTNKYTYLISTTDLVNWTTHLADKSTSSTGWQAEISELVPTNDFLWLCRADVSSPGTGLGLYKFDGTTITIQDGSAAFKAALNQDRLWYAIRGSSTIKMLDVVTQAATSKAYASVAALTGGTAAYDPTFQGPMRTVGGRVHAFTKSGYVLANQDGTAASFVPLLPSAVSTVARTLGWRGQVAYVAGGIVIAANVTDPTNLDTTSAATSLLLWIGPNGNVRVLASGGVFGGVAVFGDRLYWGVSANPHGNNFSNHQAGGVFLDSMPLSEIKTASAPYTERVYQPPAVGNLYGGWPTLGYTRGRFIANSTTSTNLNLWQWTAEQGAVKLGSVALTAGTYTAIDLSPYLGGGILGYSTDDAAAKVDGTISFW